MIYIITVSYIITVEGGRGGEGGDCTHPPSFSGDGLSHQAGAKVAADTKGKICRF